MPDTSTRTLAELSINTIRTLAMDAVQQARSGHPGTPMALAPLVSGMCLANAGLGAAHGIGAGLGATLGVSHGVACGMLLPHVMRYNIDRGVVKYAALGRAFGAGYPSEKDDALYAADVIEDLCAGLRLPCSLGELGVTQIMLPSLAKASMGSSMRKNPVEIDEPECEAFLKSIL